ncbi:MAG: hypothetical protein JWN82_539 [Candidatus Saccharibacteria bacterium]|nr:hypothetical protein [Candidatus Saccharibacteria bacterium]
MESHKLKKLTGWLLYNIGAQPTEPRPGSLHLKQPLEPEEHEPGLSEKLLQYRWALVGTAGLLLFVGLWWTAGPYLSKAQVGNQRVSLGGPETTLVSKLNAAVAAYRLPMQYTDGHSEKFPLSEVGFKLDTPAAVSDLRAAQHGTGQRFMWWRPVTKPLALKSDAKKLHAFIATKVTATVQPSQDATLGIANGEVTVKDAVTGKQYGLENPQISLLNHVAALNAQNLKIHTLTTNPAITSQELAASKTQLEQVLNQPISFKIDQKTVTPTKNDIASWLELTPDTKAKKVDIDINSGKVQEYINKIAKASVHPARDQIEITHDDGTRSVLVPGVNGVDISGKEAIATDVANNVLAGKGVQTALPVSFSPYKTISTDAYDKWIEVDITNKRMYTYEKTSLIRTFLVSAGAPKTPTVTGKYAIYSKYTQKDMRGNNVDGTKYFQPNVPWVNYFYRDYAIHGNYWRPTSYFGNINSSHGCVSTVPSDAAWIYDWAPIGTPVIIHS